MATKDKLINLEDLKAVRDHDMAIVDNKADQIGSYPDLIAGTADNLLSSSYQTDKTPYLLRRTPYGARERGSIVGGSIVWNQLAKPANNWSPNWGSGTYVAGDNEITITNAPSGYYSHNGTVALTRANHVMLAMCLVKVTNGTAGVYITNGQTVVFNKTSSSSYVLVASMIKDLQEGNNYDYRLQLRADTACESVSFKCPMFFDLTLMFGPTIADYIYTQEQATAGAGAALAKAWAGITADYYPHNIGTIKSVTGLTAHKMTGFNQWDEEWENGAYASGSGTKGTNANKVRNKNPIPILPNTEYYIETPLSGTNVYQYDADMNYIQKTVLEVAQGNTFTSLPNAFYMNFSTFGSDYKVYNNDICINISDPQRNGQYEPYTVHEYPLDSTLTLRGLPKLDGDNLYYDGDIYKADGTVERKYGVVDLGTLNWSKYGSSNIPVFYTSVDISNLKPGTGRMAKCSAYVCQYWTSLNARTDKTVEIHPTLPRPYIADSSYTDAASFKTAMSGVYLVYELATPTTEQAEPYTALQICDPNGTEEWVGALMPVGHETQYYADLKGKIEDIPDAPSADGTYTLKVTVSNGVATYSWER